MKRFQGCTGSTVPEGKQMMVFALRRTGHSLREIRKETGLAVDTIRALLAGKSASANWVAQTRQTQGLVDDFRNRLISRADAFLDNLSPEKITEMGTVQVVNCLVVKLVDRLAKLEQINQGGEAQEPITAIAGPH